ncbi:hypothetical protein [Spongorhabdus nitratireducens]
MNNLFLISSIRVLVCFLAFVYSSLILSMTLEEKLESSGFFSSEEISGVASSIYTGGHKRGAFNHLSEDQLMALFETLKEAMKRDGSVQITAPSSGDRLGLRDYLQKTNCLRGAFNNVAELRRKLLKKQKEEGERLERETLVTKFQKRMNSRCDKEDEFDLYLYSAENVDFLSMLPSGNQFRQPVKATYVTVEETLRLHPVQRAAINRNINYEKCSCKIRFIFEPPADLRVRRFSAHHPDCHLARESCPITLWEESSEPCFRSSWDKKRTYRESQRVLNFDGLEGFYSFGPMYIWYPRMVQSKQTAQANKCCILLGVYTEWIRGLDFCQRQMDSELYNDTMMQVVSAFGLSEYFPLVPRTHINDQVLRDLMSRFCFWEHSSESSSGRFSRENYFTIVQRNKLLSCHGGRKDDYIQDFPTHMDQGLISFHGLMRLNRKVAMKGFDYDVDQLKDAGKFSRDESYILENCDYSVVHLLLDAARLVADESYGEIKVHKGRYFFLGYLKFRNVTGDFCDVTLLTDQYDHMLAAEVRMTPANEWDKTQYIYIRLSGKNPCPELVDSIFQLQQMY